MPPNGDPPQWSPYDYLDPEDPFIRSPFFDVDHIRTDIQTCLTSAARAHEELELYGQQLRELAVQLARTAKSTENPDLVKSVDGLTYAANLVQQVNAGLRAAHEYGSTYLSQL